MLYTDYGILWIYYNVFLLCAGQSDHSGVLSISIDSIVKGLETAHVRPLKRVRTPRAILVTSCYELSQFRAPEKERTR